jgi:hypothetical protein
MQIAPGLNMNVNGSTVNASSNKYFMEDRYPEEVGIPYVPKDWNSIFISSLPAGFDNTNKLGYLIEVVLKLGRVKRIDYAKHGTTGKPLAFIHFTHWNNGVGVQKFRKDMETMGYIDLMGTHTFWTSSIEIQYHNNGKTESYSQLNTFFPDVPKGTYLRMMINKNPIQDTLLNIHQIAANADELHEKVIKMEEELTETKTVLHDVMAKYEVLAAKLQYVMENYVPMQPTLSKSFCEDDYEPLSLDDLVSQGEDLASQGEDLVSQGEDLVTEDNGHLSFGEDEEDLAYQGEDLDELALIRDTLTKMHEDIDVAALDLFKFNGIN